jgi:hypothetical protein
LLFQDPLLFLVALRMRKLEAPAVAANKHQGGADEASVRLVCLALALALAALAGRIISVW